jgi:cation diffusion facilitator CzcD-associated flavoprotein CzcO
MTVTATTRVQHREVVVIGSGQAGLAVGYFLAQQNRRFTILEAAGVAPAGSRALVHASRPPPFLRSRECAHLPGT